MDVRRIVNTRIWADPWFETLDTESKLVWIYLLTNQQTNLIGIYEITLRRISNETGIDLKACERVMEGFAKASKALHKGCFVVIFNWIKNQNLYNPNMEKAALKMYCDLPPEIKKCLSEHGIDDFESLCKGLGNGSQSLTKPLVNHKTKEKEIEKEKEKEIYSARTENLKEPFPATDAEPVFQDDGQRQSPIYMIDGRAQGENGEPGGGPEKRKPKKTTVVIPEFEEFMLYIEAWMKQNNKDFDGKKAQIASKYHTWRDAGWKDGYGNPIIDWKGKIRNTEPHLKSDGTSKNNQQPAANAKGSVSRFYQAASGIYGTGQ